MSCDRLCRLGYEKTQVEEALEMFQNCEAKVRHPTNQHSANQHPAHEIFLNHHLTLQTLNQSAFSAQNTHQMSI